MDIFSLISITHVLKKGRALLKGHFIYEMVVVFSSLKLKYFFHYYFLFNIVMRSRIH